VVAALIAVTVLIFYATVWAAAGRWLPLGLWHWPRHLARHFLAYNIWPVSPVKWALRRLDHSAIFILIAATYTPFSRRIARYDRTRQSDRHLAVALFGVFLKCMWPGRFDRLAIILYLAMGWSGILLWSRLHDVLSLATLILILVGGLSIRSA